MELLEPSNRALVLPDSRNRALEPLEARNGALERLEARNRALEPPRRRFELPDVDLSSQGVQNGPFLVP